MDDNDSRIERLRLSLTELEERQHATGRTADPDFFTATVGQRSALDPGPACAPDAADCDEEIDPDFGPYLGVTVDWSVLSRVKGQLAMTVAYAAEVTKPHGRIFSMLAEADLLASASQLGRLQEAREVMLVKVLTEIASRGVVTPGGLSRVDWLRTLDATLTAAQAKAVADVAVAFVEPRWQGLRSAVTGEQCADDADDADADADEGESADEGVGAARVSVVKAAAVVDFYERLRKLADPDELDQAVAHLIDQAGSLRFEPLQQLARQLADQVRPPKDRDQHDQARRSSVGLWFSAPNASGMVRLKGVFDPEGAAMIKSAIDPLSAPRPLTEPDRVEPDGTSHRGKVIEPDDRLPHQRRAEALLELIARAVSAPAGVPLTDKAKVVVTIDYDSLADRVREWATRQAGFSATAPAGSAGGGNTRGGNTGGGNTRGGERAVRTSGVCLTGDVLSPATVRRLACDAAIVPLVLGSQGEPLDVGRQERLVTRSMRTALWNRDRGCTFPGCSMPPEWTDAHHVTHWVDGGETALANLALLCRRHHTYVHEKLLTATVTPAGATWHTWQQWKAGWEASPRWPTDPPETSTPFLVNEPNPDVRGIELNRARC